MAVSVREFAPAARLQRVAEAGWIAHASCVRHHAVLPDGCIDLVFAVGPDGGGRLFVSGADSRARTVTLGPEVAYAGVRLRPGVARRVLDLAPAELLDRGLVPARGSAPLEAIEERLLPCATPLRALDRLSDELARLAGRVADPRPPERVRQALGLLRARETAARTRTVAARLGVTPRTLHREVTAWTGLSPKVLARIFRLQAALAALRRGASSLASVAAATGYADQAHMARDFRELAGRPPIAWAPCPIRSRPSRGRLRD